MPGNKKLLSTPCWLKEKIIYNILFPLQIKIILNQKKGFYRFQEKIYFSEKKNKIVFFKQENKLLFSFGKTIIFFKQIIQEK